MSVLMMIGALMIVSTASAKNPKQVKLRMVDNKLEIDTNADENDCPADEARGKGCIKVKHGETSKMYFHLKGSRNCSLDSGKKWALNAIYLGGYNSATKPDKDDFGFDRISEADYGNVSGDFNIVNRTSGLVYPLEKTDKKLAINNKNLKNPYVVWYKIEAICERSDGGEPHIATSDPRVRNGGNL